MKKVFLAILFTCVSLFAQFSGPKVSVQSDKYDFGKVKQKTTVTHEFTIKNTGNADLVIKNVKASCGCTVAKPSKEIIKPGDFAKIKVSFNTGRRKGIQRKHVYIFTNDPQKPELRLTFTATVMEDKSKSEVPKIKLSSKRVNLGNIKEGKVVEFKVKVINEGKKPLIIKKVVSSCGCTAALMSNGQIPPGGSEWLNVKFDSSKRHGKISRTVSVYSNDPARPVETITLFANIIKGKK